MSERSRFRIKNGEIEIEYEGPVKEAKERYENAFKWLTSRPGKPRIKEGETGKKTGTAEEAKKKDKRGGKRRTLYSPKITELIEEGFFKEGRKSLDEVLEGLVPKNVPTKGRNARSSILNNLKRRIAGKGSTLRGAPEENVWYFWVD